MRHRKSKVTLDRKKSRRVALLKSLLLALAKTKKIVTTDAKAKYLRKEMEKLITLSKKNTLTSRRIVYTALGGQKNGDLFFKTTQKYISVKGGYLRLTRIGSRKGDGAKLIQIEFI